MLADSKAVVPTHMVDQYGAIERLLKFDTDGCSKNIKALAAQAKLPRPRRKSWSIGPKG